MVYFKGPVYFENYLTELAQVENVYNHAPLNAQHFDGAYTILYYGTFNFTASTFYWRHTNERFWKFSTYMVYPILVKLTRNIPPIALYVSGRSLHCRVKFGAKPVLMVG